MTRPTIRAAKFADIPEIVRLAKEALSRSKYADIANLEPVMVKDAAFYCIANHAPRPGGALAVVADTGDHLEGMFIGVVRPFYECLDIKVASNLIWYSSPSASANAGLGMERYFRRWANLAEGRVLIRYGLNDAINGPMRIGRILERQGFAHVGNMYEKEN